MIMYRLKNFLFVVLFFSASVLTACTAATPENAVSETVPTPSSALIDEFVWQEDGLYAYGMLRPLNWTAVDNKNSRLYLPPEMAGQVDRVSLEAVNLALLASQIDPATGINATYALFQADPSLEGWTKGLEQSWPNLGMQFSLEEELPDARVYLLQGPGTDGGLNLAAYIVREGEPFILGIQAVGSYADIDRLRREGLYDDFLIMVESLTPIPQDPEHIDPPLE